MFFTFTLMDMKSFSAFEFRFRQKDGKKWIFDRFRRKYVVLTPEEWVRQNFLTWLTTEKAYPVSLLRVESNLMLGKSMWRFDAVFFRKDGRPAVIIECKAPDVLIGPESFEQIARYNQLLKADYLMVTNGERHYCCKMDYHTRSWIFLQDIPDWKTISESASD